MRLIIFLIPSAPPCLLLGDRPLFSWRWGMKLLQTFFMHLCKHFFRTTISCKRFFPNHFNHILAQKKEVPFLLSNNNFLQTFFPIYFNHILTQKEVPFLLPSVMIWYFTVVTNKLEKEKSKVDQNPPVTVITACECYLVTSPNSSFSFSETCALMIGGSEKWNHCLNFKISLCYWKAQYYKLCIEENFRKATPNLC